jgi:dienelactone hydrolase
MLPARWTRLSNSMRLSSILGVAFVAGSLWATSLVMVTGPLSHRALAQGKGGETTMAQPVSFQTEDGFTLRGTYYRASEDKESKDAAVVVLLHMKDGYRGIWEGENGIARKLQSKGMAVITVDLRNHGESKPAGAAPVGNPAPGKTKGKKDSGMQLKPAEFQAMLQLDLEAVKKFIFEEHQAGRLNMNKMGIVGAEMSASLAAAYTSLDWAKEPYDDGQPGFQTPRGQDIRAVVLISPDENYHGSGLKLGPVLQSMRDPDKLISVLVCSGNDPKEVAHSNKVFDILNPLTPGSKEKERLNSGRMFQTVLPARLTGTNLLGNNLEIEPLIVNFFDKHLKTINVGWRNRESKRNIKKK